jgi:hypothetical protein
MSHIDDHVIPYEEAVRRRRAREARKERSAAGELKISDAMSHLLEQADAQDDGGHIPAHLRDIVEREFADGEPPPGRPSAGRPGGDA